MSQDVQKCLSYADKIPCLLQITQSAKYDETLNFPIIRMNYIYCLADFAIPASCSLSIRGYDQQSFHFLINVVMIMSAQHSPRFFDVLSIDYQMYAISATIQSFLVLDKNVLLLPVHSITRTFCRSQESLGHL